MLKRNSLILNQLRLSRDALKNLVGKVVVVVWKGDGSGRLAAPGPLPNLHQLEFNTRTSNTSNRA
jgi:hypothetical protein